MFSCTEMTYLVGTEPVVIQAERIDVPKATTEELFGQIASDLKNAVELMPSQGDTSVPSGRATRWAAQALMARVYLFYTGFYGKDSIALPDGGTVTKANVTEWLNDCIDNSGYDLVNDFRRLWAYSNSKTVSSLDDDNEIKKNGLIWAEAFGAPSPETVFSIKFSNQSKHYGGYVLAL